MDKKQSDVLSPNLKVLTVLGIWPTRSNILYNIWTALIMTMVVAMLMLEYVYFFQIFGNVAAMTACSFVLIEFSINLFKCYAVYCRRKDFQTMQDFMDNPQFKPQNDREEKIIGDAEKYYKTLYYVCVILGGGCGVVWVLNPIIMNLKGELPIKVYIPFNKTVPHMYEIMYGLQIIIINWNCYFDLNFDVFAAGFLLFLCTQLDILRDRIETRDPSTVKESFQLYIVILKFARVAQSLYNVMVFAQFTAGVLVFCSTFMQLSLVETYISVDMISLIMYLTSIIIELFLFCWQGSELFYKSYAIGTSLFHAPWIDATPAQKNNYYTFMQMAQTPIIMKVGGLIPMSVNSFTGILRTSYSYFTVLGNFKIDK